MKNPRTVRAFSLTFLTLLALSITGLLGTILFCLARIFLGSAMVIIMIARAAMNSVDQDDVWNALSLTVWKTELRIADELVQERRIKGSARQIAGIIIHLASFQAEGLVECRADPIAVKHLIGRGKKPPFEYKRISGGGRPRRRKWLPNPLILIPAHEM